MPRAHGRAGEIKTKTTNIEIIIEEVDWWQVNENS
jgi:ribosomal protein L22